VSQLPRPFIDKEAHCVHPHKHHDSGKSWRQQCVHIHKRLLYTMTSSHTLRHRSRARVKVKVTPVASQTSSLAYPLPNS